MPKLKKNSLSLSLHVNIMKHKEEIVHCQVKTDHKLLIMIMQKSQNKTLSWLQRISLKLWQRQTLCYLPNTNSTDFVYNLQSTDHTITLLLSVECLRQLEHASRDDPVQ